MYVYTCIYIGFLNQYRSLPHVWFFVSCSVGVNGLERKQRQRSEHPHILSYWLSSFEKQFNLSSASPLFQRLKIVFKVGHLFWLMMADKCLTYIIVTPLLAYTVMCFNLLLRLVRRHFNLDY